MATWIWSVVTAGDLRGLEIQEGEIPEEDQPANIPEGLDTFRSTDRIVHFERLRNRWVMGIAVLAVLVAGLHLIASPLVSELLVPDPGHRSAG